MKMLLCLAFALTCFSGFCQKMDKYNGFLKNVDGTYFFFEITGDTLLPSRIAVFTEDTVGLAEITNIKRAGRFGDDPKHIILYGNKTDDQLNYNGNSFQVIKIRNVEPYTIFDFRIDKSHKVIDNEEYIEAEGYYTAALESILFHYIQDNKDNGANWVRFSKELQAVDSLKYIMGHKYNTRGIYLKVSGIKKYGGSYGYGHFGGRDTEILITKIIAADTTRTYKAFLRDKLLEQGYLEFYGERRNVITDLEIGKTYTFSGKNRKYNCKLKLQKNNIADIEYTLAYYRGKKLEKSVKGIVTVNPYTLRWSEIQEPRYEYESFDEKYSYGYSTFNITFDIQGLTDENGKITLVVTDDFSWFSEETSIYFIQD